MLDDAMQAKFDNLVSQLTEQVPDRVELFNLIRRMTAIASGTTGHPVSVVRWVPIEQVFANDYNPNAVALNEMRLLYVSISHDGYTQPVVTVWDDENKRYVIVDGFHRYTTALRNPDVLASTGGLLPIVVLDKAINDRMASTVRHNRARGKHSITGMASMVFAMLDNGWTDEAICAEIGVGADELLRLKHVTGFSKLFDSVEYRKAWETKSQIKLKVAHGKTAEEPT